MSNHTAKPTNRSRWLFGAFAAFALSSFSSVSAQTYFNMGSSNYSEDFADISNTTLWPNGFAAGSPWSSLAVDTTGSIPSATRITTSSATFVTGGTGGVQRGTQNIQLLSTGTTDNTTSVAIDLNLNFTGRVAGNLSFDAATVFNSTGNRTGTLRVYYSTDSTTWTELSGGGLPYVATNNVTGSAAVSLALPSTIDNQATTKLRFYYHNGSGGTTGSRPKISIDNVLVTSTGGDPLPNPTVGTTVMSLITETTATATATFAANEAEDFTEYGFIIAENSVNPDPSPGDGDVAKIDFTSLPVPNPITAELVGLSASTEYAIRAYVIYDSGAEVELGAVSTFTTLDPDTTAPTLASTTPAANATNVALDTALVLTFSEPVVAATGNLELYEDGNPTPIATIPTADADIAGAVATFTLVGPLDFETTYHVLVEEASFEDLAENPFAGISSGAWSFTTAPLDTTGPVPVEFTPASGATGVPLDTFILRVVFDKEITLVGEDFIEIRRVADDSLLDDLDPTNPFEVTPDSENPQELVLFLTEALQPGTEYYVFIPEGTVEDSVGNPNLAFGEPTSDFPWTFSTPAPPVLPVLDGINDYVQDFSGFVSTETLPDGWSISAGGNNDYRGDWGTGTTNGWRGNANVLGFQHSGDTNTALKTLTLQNTSGTAITSVFISYDGRVARADQGRNPVYTVTVDGNPAATLTYDTNEGDGVTKTAIITGLFIEDGEFFDIVWSSQRGGGSGSSKQIGISNLVVSLDVPLSTPPSVASVSIQGPITSTGFGVESGVIDEGTDEVSAFGFVIAETALQPNPVIGDPDTTVVDLFDDFFSFVVVDYDFTGLEPGTSYSVRFFATSAAGTTYSAPVSQLTLNPAVPLVADGYEENFLEFTGIPSLPDGWSVVSTGGITNYVGDWGSGTAGGFRGPGVDATQGVLGYQHTSSTGELIVTLEMINDTGAEITSLFVSYLGRVERANQTRSPAWTFRLNGDVVPDLAYSTAEGIDKTVEYIITGLSIAEGATFTLSWTSDRGEPSDSSKQIGLADVVVESVIVNVETPILSLPSGTYLEDQIVFITNAGDYSEDVGLFYTLDGSTPDASSFEYDVEGGIYIEDGSGPVTLRVIAIDSVTAEASIVATRTYTFPVNVANLSALRAASIGTLYRVTGEVIVSHIDSFRNQKYIQDGGAAIQIDDTANFLGSAGYGVGDGITGITGNLNAFNGMLQLVPALSTGSLSSLGGAPSPTLVTLAELEADPAEYQARLIRVNNVRFTAPGTFANGTLRTLENASDPSQSFGFRDAFDSNTLVVPDYLGDDVPVDPIDLIGIVITNTSLATQNFITARTSADFIPSDGPSGDFASWIAGFDVGTLTGPYDIPMNDGVPNILKHVLGLAADVAVTGALLEVAEAGAGTLTFLHTKIKEADLASDAIFGYEWSMDLVNWAADGDSIGGVTVVFAADVIDGSDPAFDVVEAAATVTAGTAGKLFVRILADIENTDQ